MLHKTYGWILGTKVNHSSIMQTKQTDGSKETIELFQPTTSEGKDSTSICPGCGRKHFQGKRIIYAPDADTKQYVIKEVKKVSRQQRKLEQRECIRFHQFLQKMKEQQGLIKVDY